jgi:YfiH family protein
VIRHESGIGFFNLESLNDRGIFNAFLTRHQGFSKGPYSSLNLGLRTSDEHEAVRKNEAAVRRAFGLSSVVRARQVHGKDVVVIHQPVKDETRFLAQKADALITDQPKVALAVLTADCFPVILADKSRTSVAMIHVGRVGVCKGIIERTVEKMSETFGARPDEMRSGVGPGIGPCCYQVNEAIARDFRTAFPAEADQILDPASEGLFSLNLFRAIEISLRRAGVREIERVELCTSCRDDLFFSHRRDKGRTGRQINLVMIPETDYL